MDFRSFEGGEGVFYHHWRWVVVERAELFPLDENGSPGPNVETKCYEDADPVIGSMVICKQMMGRKHTRQAHIAEPLVGNRILE